MRYASMRSMDITNGDGVGVSLFVQGCHLHCKGCFNQETWDFNGGNEWNNASKHKFLSLVAQPFVNRVSILGGDPMMDENANEVFELLFTIRRDFQHTKKIWLYSGLTWDSICSNDDVKKAILRMCDVFVDGPYVAEKRNMNLKFRGSTNQRVIDVQKSIFADEVVLYTEE